MNKAQRIIIVSLIALSIGNVSLVLKNKIKQLSEQNQLFKEQSELYKNSLALLFTKNNVPLANTDNYQNILYFPSKACSSCLENLLLLIDNEDNIKKNVIIYFDNIEKVEIINQFNDMYGTNYSHFVGKPLFYNQQSHISILNVNNGVTAGGILFEAKNKNDFEFQLQVFKDLNNDKY